MSQPPLVPTTASGSALWAAPSSAVTGGSLRWAYLLSCPLFSPLLMAHLTPWREGGRKEREDNRRYGKKSGQLANRRSRFPRLSVSTVPCSLGRVSLPWPALVSQLENEGIALTDVSRPSLPENCSPATGLPSLAPAVSEFCWARPFSAPTSWLLAAAPLPAPPLSYSSLESVSSSMKRCQKEGTATTAWPLAGSFYLHPPCGQLRTVSHSSDRNG